MDCIRALGGCSLDFPNKSSSSLSFSALTSSKVKPLALNAVTYFFTVFLDASVCAAMVIRGRCWLYIFSIFLILLMLIVKLAILGQVFCPQKMVTSTALATRLWWSISPGMPWSVSPGMGGQLAPEWSGHVHQNLQQREAKQISEIRKSKKSAVDLCDY